MAILNRMIPTLSQKFWRTERSLLLWIHTQRLSQRPSSYVNVPFPICTSVLIPAGINRCILYFLGCHCRTVGGDRRAFQLDNCIFPDLTFLQKMSAFNTRTIKNPNMFVRTHVAFYFVSLLLSDILQCESQIIHTLTVYVLCAAHGPWS